MPLAPPAWWCITTTRSCTALALLHAPMRMLTTAPGWRLAMLEEMAATGAGMIRLTGNADPHAFDGLDPTRIAAQPTELAIAARRAMLGWRDPVEHCGRTEPRVG